MKKLFALVALVGMGAFIAGCAEEKPAPKPPVTPAAMPGMKGAEMHKPAVTEDGAGAKEEMPADGDKAADDADKSVDGDKPSDDGDKPSEEDKPSE